MGEPTAPTPAVNDDYVFVEMPDGSVRAVLKTDVKQTYKSEAPVAEMVEVEEAEFYVHLANGEVVRVKESDLPASAGTNATDGFWQKDGNVYLVIAVYPVEHKAEGKKFNA